MSEDVGEVAQGQLFSSFALQIIFNGAFGMLWNIFNTLQVILALPLLMVNFPGNTSTIVETLDSIINFEIIPKEKIYDATAVPLLGVDSA